MSEYSPNIEPIPPTSGNEQRLLGWSAMLAKWTEFTKASIALPKDQDGPRWRRCVAPIITMQALIAALNELDQLPKQHQPVAIDAAETLLREQLALVHEAWSGELFPDSLLDLIHEARRAVFDAAHTGTEWRVTADQIFAPDLRPLAAAIAGNGFRGDMHAATAGTVLFRGTPLAFFRPALSVNPPEGCETSRVVGPRQCYRQRDEPTGEPVRDVICGPSDPLMPGVPLLAPLILDGEIIPAVANLAPIAPASPLPVLLASELDA
ncbi:MAG: hypothetical protein H6814_04555 [Phycisphaeraceae bacterium]|nr:hypothetical protein [Phycisphaeraceae bacterium]